MKEPIHVRILDQDYLIRSDEDKDEVLRIAQFVDDAFREIKAHTEGLSERKTATLAAFHIASEYFQVLRQRDRLVAEVQRKAQQLNTQIDAALD